MRDQAYSLLKDAVDEIRVCSQYVFWDNTSLRDSYSSEYLRSLRKAAGGKSPETDPSEEVSA